LLLTGLIGEADAAAQQEQERLDADRQSRLDDIMVRSLGFAL